MGQITFKNSSVKFKSGTLKFFNNKTASPSIGTISYSSGQIRYYVTNNDTVTVQIYGNVESTSLVYLGDLTAGSTVQFSQSFPVPPSGAVLTISVQARVFGKIDSDVVSKQYTYP